jgi:hypothetical protein
MSKAGTIVRDSEHPTMYRVRMPDGEQSDLLNKHRATELSRLLVRREERKLWAKEVSLDTSE